MIRSGKLCKGCTHGRCNDKPTCNEPAIIECPACAGKGCTHCDEVGSFELVECPQDYVDDMVDLVPFVDHMDNGCLPVDGGALDQSNWFMDAARRLKSETEANQGRTDG